MTEIAELRTVILALLSVGVIVRVSYCFLAMSAVEDKSQYKTRALNAVIFSIIAMSLTQITSLLFLYFGG